MNGKNNNRYIPWILENKKINPRESLIKSKIFVVKK